jgi:hypothetical protein
MVAVTIISTDLTNDDARPYFLWDEQRTVGELREAIASAEPEEWSRLVGKLMREARDEDVWKFVTPEQAWQGLDSLEPYLGRRRDFWRYLLEAWYRDGYLLPRSSVR